MSTQAQIDANRRNAQSSTGPRTPEGKAAVSQNAFRHGLRSSTYRDFLGAPEVFDAVRDQIFADHEPQTATEAIYVHRMIVTECKLAELEERVALLWDKDDIRERLHKEQIMLERSFDRALVTLQKLQKDRRAQENAESKLAEKVEEQFLRELEAMAKHALTAPPPKLDPPLCPFPEEAQTTPVTEEPEAPSEAPPETEAA
jgi:hypothetical protein